MAVPTIHASSGALTVLVHSQEAGAGEMSHVPSWAVPAQGDARLEVSDPTIATVHMLLECTKSDMFLRVLLVVVLILNCTHMIILFSF